MYVNFEADDNWKQELAEVSQIIALTTQVQQLSTKLETTIALATTDNESGKAGSDIRRTNNNKKYTVAPWGLVKKGDTIKCDKGHTWHWCTEENYSGGAAHKGMYATHPPGKHAEWRAEIDRKRATPGGAASTTSSDPSQTVVNDDIKKKLALSEKLCTALNDQAGLSQEAFTRILGRILQGLGKRLGPNRGWSLMWIIILPLILLKLLIRTTLTSPTLLLSITK